MKCPHCGKIVLLVKDTSQTSAPKETVDTSGLGQLLESVDEGSLDDESAGFYRQTKERFEQYGDRTRMSFKQMAWLRKLAAGDAQDTW